MRSKILSVLFIVALCTVSFGRPIQFISTSGNLPLACDGDVVASGGDIRITLPAPPSDGCDIIVVNTDSAAGKLLIGFPTDIRPKLYPNQVVGITSSSGNWVSKYKPGRWAIPGDQKIIVDPAGDDDNDGISLPLKHIQTAVQVLQQDLDSQQALAAVAANPGVYSNDSFQIQGQTTGNNLVVFTVTSAGSVTITNQHACITVSDNAELYIWPSRYDAAGQFDLYCNQSNSPNTGQIVAHNNGLFDMAGKVVIHGSGDQDNGFFFDGAEVGASISDGFYATGTFDSFWRMDEGGGRFTLGCQTNGCNNVYPISPLSANHMFMVLGSQELILGGCPVNDGYTFIGPTIIGGNGILLNLPNCSIPGSVTLSQNGKVYTTKF